MPIWHQYARDCLRERQTYYQKQPRHAGDAILVGPMDVVVVVGPMDTCVVCRIVEYLFIVYWPSVCDIGFVLTTIFLFCDLGPISYFLL